MNIWFTADNHFGHKNIIKFADRPFASAEEMDETMIDNWNSKVNDNDIVYHMGDFSFLPSAKLKQLRQRLNGKICLIKGNHDSSAEQCPECFEWIKDYYELTVDDPDAHLGKRPIILMHYAMRVWNISHYGSWHLYGHSHGDLPDDETSLSFDVGVDCHNFFPLSYNDVKKVMALKKWVPPFEPRN